MSMSAARRGRLLRFRTIEHRVAALRLAAADAAHAEVGGVRDRVAQLRDGIIIPTGSYRGHDLQCLCELSERLDRARLSLRASLAEAQATRDARNVRRVAAHVAEERTSRAHASALQREAAAQELRAASSHPHRRKAGWPI
jgi:hypothetical protein